jgi:hypothetical protein
MIVSSIQGHAEVVGEAPGEKNLKCFLAVWWKLFNSGEYHVSSIQGHAK